MLTLEQTTKRAKEFLRGVKRLVDAGMVTKPLQVSENCIAVTVWEEGWHTVAKEFMQGQAGCCRLISGGGIAWQVGCYIMGTILPVENLYDRPERRGILSAQKIVSAITGMASTQLWTNGALCRSLIPYIGKPEPFAKGARNAEVLLDGITYGYMQVEPGQYEKARYYDVSGFYADILSRFPHLQPDIVGNDVQWRYDVTGEGERLREVLTMIGEHKALRNTLAGVLAGSNKWGQKYVWDKSLMQVRVDPEPPIRSMFRSAGLLIMRQGYELTYAETAGEGTVYSRVDSLITLGEGTGAWKRAGFHVKTVAEGDAHIIRLGAYKIGNKSTEPYRDSLHNDWLVAGEDDRIARLPPPKIIFAKGLT